MQPISVTSSDGLTLSAQEWGNPKGREILFIHGFNQCHLSWQRQVTDDALARDFRMITFDLRGHGASDKPRAVAAYVSDEVWGGDVAAVIAAAGLQRPVVVGWSFGGRVISDFVKTHGAARLAGVNYVAAVTKSAGEFVGPGRVNFPGMASDDLATNIAATRGFLRSCFERQPSAEEFETVLAFNMVVPAYVRAAVGQRPPNPGDTLAQLTCPVLVTHGSKDQLILPPMAAFHCIDSRRRAIVAL